MARTGGAGTAGARGVGRRAGPCVYVGDDRDEHYGGQGVRKKNGNGYVYEPKITRESTTRRMLRDTVNRLFDGSVSAAVVHLLDEGELSENEMRELQKLVRGKKEKRS